MMSSMALAPEVGGDALAEGGELGLIDSGGLLIVVVPVAVALAERGRLVVTEVVEPAARCGVERADLALAERDTLLDHGLARGRADLLAGLEPGHDAGGVGQAAGRVDE